MEGLSGNNVRQILPSFIPATQTTATGLVGSLIIALAVFTVSAAAQKTTAVPKGEWGGRGIAMTITDAGASIQFDCADGTITKQLRINKDGGFTAEGTLMRNGPGPIRVGAQGLAVIFTGKVTRKTMTLRMSDAKSGEKLGEYAATLGQTTRLHRCY